MSKTYRPPVRRALVLEDDFELAMDYAAALRSDAFEVQVAQFASEAIEFAKISEFDLVVADIFVQRRGELVPDGGLTFISALRRSVGFKTAANVPILAVSGSRLVNSDMSPLRMAMTVGATATLAKPVDMFELVDEANRLLQELRR